MALSFFFEPETVSICDFDGSATLMAQGITELFKVKGDFSHLPSSVDSALITFVVVWITSALI